MQRLPTNWTAFAPHLRGLRSAAAQEVSIGAAGVGWGAQVVGLGATGPGWQIRINAPVREAVGKAGCTGRLSAAGSAEGRVLPFALPPPERASPADGSARQVGGWVGKTPAAF